MAGTGCRAFQPDADRHTLTTAGGLGPLRICPSSPHPPHARGTVPAIPLRFATFALVSLAHFCTGDHCTVWHRGTFATFSRGSLGW